MPLSSDPSVTFNSEGNILATTTSLGSSASSTGNIVDVSANSLGGWVQVYSKGGASVSTTNGCQVSIYPAGSSTPTYDSVAMWTFTIPNTASTVARESILLPTGKYSITLANLDASNSINVGITSNPIA
jgi:hypothetical protein